MENDGTSIILGRPAIAYTRSFPRDTTMKRERRERMGDKWDRERERERERERQLERAISENGSKRRMPPSATTLWHGPRWNSVGYDPLILINDPSRRKCICQESSLGGIVSSTIPMKRSTIVNLAVGYHREPSRGRPERDNSDEGRV